MFASENLAPVLRHVKIHGAWQGMTVLEVVRRVFPEIVPRQVFRKVRNREILKGESPCHALDRLMEGDVLSVVVHRPAPCARLPVLRENQEVITAAGPVWIVREDSDLLVVSKAAGCVSHPALRHSGDTLIDRIRCLLGVSAEDPFQPALANRLDLGTSGIVLAGKTKKAQSRLGRHLQRGRLRKLYLALVGGWPETPGEINLPLMRHPDSRDLARFRNAGGPQPQGKVQDAVTRYRVLEQLRSPVAGSVVEVELLTGRTHQIRRHFAHAGHPVAGDTRYGDPELNHAIRAVGGLGRMFLHAHRVCLDHPTSGEPLDLRAPLPPELLSCLAALGATPPL